MSLGSLFSTALYFMPPNSGTVITQQDILRELDFIKFRQEYYKDYYDERIAEIREFFGSENFDVASVLFDFLLEKKSKKLRKNGYVPDYGHEIDQLIPVINVLKNRKISPEDRAEIERQHGSMERWFCSILAHDLGEDFGLFPEDLQRVLVALLDARNIVITAHHRDVVIHASKSMECLTHYRKFSLQQMQEMIGERFKFPNIKPGEVVPLPELKNFFWDKMDVLKQGRENLQVFAKWDPKKSDPVIIITRYGATPESAPQDEQEYSVEWNVYIQTLLQDDIYDALVKMGDRVTGMATRPGINARDPEKYDTYLDETEFLFSHLGAANMLAEYFYKDSPLIKYAHSISKMMGGLDRIGSLWISAHPTKNLPGQRSISPENILHGIDNMDGISPIYMSEFYPQGLEFWEGVPQESHPLFQIIRDLRDAYHPDFRSAHYELPSYFIGALSQLDLPEMETIFAPDKTVLYGDKWFEHKLPDGYDDAQDYDIVA